MGLSVDQAFDVMSQVFDRPKIGFVASLDLGCLETEAAYVRTRRLDPDTEYQCDERSCAARGARSHVLARREGRGVQLARDVQPACAEDVQQMI
jgi:hypothetical protein